jgi:hypothetical protein
VAWKRRGGALGMHLQAKRQRNYVARRKIEARERGTERAKQVVC